VLATLRDDADPLACHEDHQVLFGSLRHARSRSRRAGNQDRSHLARA
jgi:hypothetical protein